VMPSSLTDRRATLLVVSSPGRWRLSLLGLCSVLLVPLLLVDLPPLLDYPNHLASLVVLAAGARDPILSRFYASHWGVIPDLGLDIIGVWLLHLLPVHVAGRVLIAIALLLQTLGSVAYARVAVGRTWWSLACGLVAFNETLLLGFLNFTAATGLALLLAAGWLRWREAQPGRAVALAIPGAVALFFCHLMGLLLFAVLIGAHEVTALRRVSPRSIARRAAVLGLVFVVPLMLYAVSGLQGMDGDAEFLSPAAKAAQLLAPFVNYSLPLDLLTAGLAIGFVLVCGVTHHCRVPLRSGLAIIAVTVLYGVAPFGYKGTFNLDTRFAIILGLLLFAGLAPVGLPRWAARAAAVVFVGLFAARMTLLAVAWHHHAADLTELRATIASVPPEDLVLLTTVSPTEAPAYWRDGPLSRRLSDGQRTDVHTAALLLIERRAFWPFLFDNASQQPITTLEPYRALASRAEGIRDHRTLTAGDLCGFDHLLLLDAGGDPDLDSFAGDRLRLIKATDYAALFVILPNPVCSQPGQRGTVR
jgi:hypothetical protein